MVRKNDSFFPGEGSVSVWFSGPEDGSVSV